EDLTDEVSGTGVLSDEAINNESTRDQKSWGADVQLVFKGNLGEHENYLVTGLGYFDGSTHFDARVELAELDPVTRSTEGLGTGAFVDSEATQVHTDTQSSSVYFTDTFSITKELALNFAGRYNDTSIELRDQSGERPELNGDHSFHRFNPA